MILPLSASGPRALRPHRDLSNSLLLNFPREKLSFMDLPPSRPATTIRLPRSVSDILRANSRVDRANAAQHASAFKTTTTITEDDRLSEADSSVPPHSGLSASTSTLGTAETAETELTPPSSALENNVPASTAAEKVSKKKSKQQAAEKRKRRREKERLAKQAIAASSANEDKTQEAEEDDGRAAALAKFRNRSDSTSTVSSLASSKAPVTVSVPQSSTSKLLASNPVPVWADDLPDSTPIESHDFATLENDETTALSPRHKILTLEDRANSFQRSRRGSRSSLHSANLSRRSSVQDSRPYSPASSQGGWQEVQSRVSKKPAPPQPALRPGNAFVKRSISKEPIWTHDKFEEQRNSDDRPKSRPFQANDFPSRPSEALWLTKPAFPQLFNEPGSRLIIDDKGRRKMTLRISLRPIYQLAAIPNKRLARERAGVVEFDMLLQVEPSTSSSAPPPLGEDISIIIKLDFKATPIRLPSRVEKEQEQIEATLPPKVVEAAQETVKEETAPEQSEAINVKAEKAEPKSSVFAQEIALGFQQQPPQDEEVHQRLETPVDVLYSSAPTQSQDALAEASAHLRSAVMTPSEEQPSSAHIPSVEQQMAAQDQQTASQLPQPPAEGFYAPEGFPQFPLFHEPFLGMDGFTYYFDPSTGQSVPGPPLPFAPGFAPTEFPPRSASPIPFFQPRRSHKIEIKAPTAEDLAELRSRPKSFNKHRQTTSTSHRSQPSYPIEEQPPPEMFIPGSFEAGGSIYFAPPVFTPGFSAPPHFFAPPSMPQDPAILAMGAANSTDAHPPQAMASPPVGS